MPTGPRRAPLRDSGEVEKPAETLAHPRPLTGDVAGELVLVEHAPEGGEESRQLAGERGVMFSGVCKRRQLLADEIVERISRAEVSLDALGRTALLDPDFFETHGWPTISSRPADLQ